MQRLLSPVRNDSVANGEYVGIRHRLGRLQTVTNSLSKWVALGLPVVLAFFLSQKPIGGTMTTEQVFDFTVDEFNELYLTFRGKASDTLSALANARRDGSSELETILLNEYELYKGIADKISHKYATGR
jgi:hypothetical protein